MAKKKTSSVEVQTEDQQQQQQQQVETTTIQTRKNEEIYTTDIPELMLGKYLATHLRRQWTEDFIDEDTGEVASVTRFEIILSEGTLIDIETLTRIQFHMTAGDISQVEVTNQLRQAVIHNSKFISPWSVNVSIGSKNRRILLYANSIFTALEIAQDYVELNFTGFCYIIGAKEFDSSIFIKDSLTKSPDEIIEPDRAFYKIEVEVQEDDTELHPYTFVLQTKDVDSGMIIINDWIANRLKDNERSTDNDNEDSEVGIVFTTTIKSAVVIPCYRMIDREFSQAYLTPLNE